MSMFNYLNLHTVYACSGEFTESVYPDGDYCFRRIFHRREILSSRKHIEETYNVNEGKKLSFDLLKDELNENKKQIELLNEDIKFQQTQWSIMWDSELMKNIVLEGRISATAQQKISDDNTRIEELNNRNKEINQELREYAESGISIEKVETKTDRAKSLCDLIGAIMGISANIIQLIFLLVPSFFIDAINVLSLQIYCQKFEEKEEND